MSEKSYIVAADDQLDNQLILEELLSPFYHIKTLSNGQELIDYISTDNPVDLILLDIIMPVMDGFTACQKIKSMDNFSDTPIIFLTSLESYADEQHGLTLGAEDFIHKPFTEPVLLARINNHLRISEMSKQLRMRNDELEAKISERNKALLAAQDTAIAAFCSLAEKRDNETGNHILRTQSYVKVLAEGMSKLPQYHNELTEENINAMYRSSPLHDIGKVGVPDAILNKPGKLTPEEWEIMKQHSQIGAEVISQSDQELGDNIYLKYGRQIAHYHHEKWDGSGYPSGLIGESIPLSARLMAVADVYDALISKRCYKEPFSHDKAVSIISEGKGNHFDPTVVEIFLTMTDKFQEIANKFAD